jgi:phosphoribosyl 1,2-cyclic phosphate phosphodiesterase
VLVDTSPDMREQLIDANVSWIDGVLFTHDHADQCHGIDDLRMIAHNGHRRVDVWMDRATTSTLTTRFRYCFLEEDGSGYPAILDAHLIDEMGKPIRVEGAGGTIEAIPFDQDHGAIRSLGFRFAPLAYSRDVVGMPDESFELVEGVECWIVDALRYTPHPTHAHVDLALQWIARANAPRGVLTNLHVDLDYQKLASELPEGVEPAYDGMTLEFEF